MHFFTIAASIGDLLGTVQFCDELNGAGECMSLDITDSQCIPIPDSNAKCDNGSSYVVSLLTYHFI